MQNPWHSQSIEEIYQALKTSENGLTAGAVLKNREKFGWNEIEKVRGNTWLHILFSQFFNVMVLILAVAMVVSLLAGEKLEAIAVGIIILINAIIGFIQEYRAERAVEALRNMAAPHALVIREGQTLQIPAKELVPGDLILLEEGMLIPADARIIHASQMKNIESSLTGESNPVEKMPGLVKKFDSIGDLRNMVFMGTVLSQGHGQAVVVETGMRTEFGKIADMVQIEKNTATPLQKQLAKLSRSMAILAVILVLALFGLSFLTQRDPLEMFLLSISLAVSLIPEGLPAVITLTLAIGVQRIAKKNAIIRKLPAAETLGSTSVICTDKTGTLTQNQMTVQLLHVNDEEFHVPGIGYDPKGDFPVDPTKWKPMELLLMGGALCNNAKLLQEKGNWAIAGDPTEGCLLTLAKKAGLDLAALEKKHPRKEELIFDSERKRMSTWNKDRMFTKGAPDSVLSVCTHHYENNVVKALTPAKRKALLKKSDQLAQNAYRVLAFATKEVSKKADFKEEKLVFLGLAGLIDPPREEVKEAIARCASANINVIMITGDHALTAQAIGEKIGLTQKGDRIVTGAELEKMSASELRKSVDSIRIFARVNPSHKVKILKALQERGHIVAMTGDGVNDAPALKRADIGVAMGITGTDVSKESSEMIITDDNFATIVSTVESGRVIYRNIKKFIRFLLSANFGEFIVIIAVFLLGYPLPFLPLQILWINLLTDALPAIALGMDKADEDIMELKPRHPKTSIWSDLLSFSLIAGLISAAISLFLYFKVLPTSSIEHTRTLMFTTIVIFELMLVFAIRSENRSCFRNFFSNKFLLMGVLISLGFQFLAIYNPLLQQFLQTTPLTKNDWAWIVSLCVAGIAILEIWKLTKPKSNHV